MIYETFEYIDIEILSNNKIIRIVALYRPPSNNTKKKFIEEFSNYLDTIDELKTIIICGDFNLWLDDIEDSYTKEFMELLETHDLVKCSETNSKI